MSSEEKKILDIMRELGFTSNASKAYLSLLKKSPSTGYEISARSGVPRSAIYSVLNRLESRGLINANGSEPRRFIPISPSSLLEFLSQSHRDHISDLAVAFDKLGTREEVFDFWHLQGYRNLILKMRESISAAKKSVFLSVWPKEYDSLKEDLKEAHERGVEVILFSFCTLPDSIGTVISYGLKEIDLLKIWNPKIILVVDQQTSIMGSTLNISESKAIWTSNKAITEIATNHIVLDITLAGQRLKMDVNNITQLMMRRGDINLDRLLEEKVL